MIREYTVTKDILNIRSKATDESDDTYRGFLLKGSKVWVYEDDIIGIVPRGGESNIWKIEVKSGNVISRDGLRVAFQQYIDERFDKINLKGLIDYNFLLNIPEEIKQSGGKDAVIGILDVPISTKLSFENIIRPGNIITENSPTEHSNFIAGIIGCKSAKNIQGICSKATILDLTFNDASGNLIQDDDYYKRLVSSIESFDDVKVIINVSNSLSDSLKFAIDKLKDVRNVIFVCAAGTDTDLLNIDNCALADSPNAIPVGTASVAFLNANNSPIDKRLNIVLPILDYASYNDDGATFLKVPDSSSSWGTAVVSSIIALLYSHKQLNENSTTADIISKIQGLSNGSHDFLNPLKL